MDFRPIEEAVSELGGRRVADAEWGLEIECAGTPLHIGLRVHRGLLRAQAAVAWPGTLDPADLLHRNRSLELVRYASTRAGEVWVVGDVPAENADVDRLLGALVEAAQAARLRERSL